MNTLNILHGEERGCGASLRPIAMETRNTCNDQENAEMTRKMQSIMLVSACVHCRLYASGCCESSRVFSHAPLPVLTAACAF